MQSVKRIASREAPVLAIVTPEKRVGRLELLLDKYAMHNWRSSNQIFIMKIADQYANSTRHISAAIKNQSKEYCLDNAENNVRYIVLKELDFNKNDGIPWVKSRDFISIVELKTLSHDLLEIRLKEWGLDWKYAVLEEIKKWQHDEISKANVDSWLSQFDRLSGGKERWVGELLLRNFKVLSSDQIASSLQSTVEKMTADGEFCIIRYENGKSADSIAVLLRKKFGHQLENSEVRNFVEILNSETDTNCTYYVFEDGIFTGIEISDLLKSLMGIKGFKKCPPLKNPQKLKTRKTYIHFVLGTDIGIHRISETIKELNIDIEVLVGTKIPLLTESGLENLQAGVLYDLDDDGKTVLRTPDKDIHPQAFLDDCWLEKRSEAISFCHKVGMQLFRSYQQKKGKTWSNRRLNDCALGAGNMALLLAFTHSIPKSTLPMFWCHGICADMNEKLFNWYPLFPSAHLV